MFSFKRTERLSMFLLIALVIILIEGTLFESDLIFSLFFGAAMIYFGRRWMEKLLGKILFWFGCFMTVIVILGMTSLRLLLIAAVCYALYQLVKSKKQPTAITLNESLQSVPLRPDHTLEHPFFSNQLFSVQSSPEQAYEWKDIHIQGLFGDVEVDVSNTVLPKGTAIISIRQLIGKVKIDVPYEVPVRIRFATLAGNAYVFHKYSSMLWNDTFYFEDDHHVEQQGAETTLVILVSTILGDIEVNRV